MAPKESKLSLTLKDTHALHCKIDSGTIWRAAWPQDSPPKGSASAQTSVTRMIGANQTDKSGWKLLIVWHHEQDLFQLKKNAEGPRHCLSTQPAT